MKNTASTRIDMLDLPDCSSLNEKGGCKLLNISRCTGQSCQFAHSTDDEKRAALNWRKRLCALSDEEQMRISKKYYGGAMPWK
ncbi:MAG: hypothetical protein IJ007_03445 [Oscillospiraceae bacterium]|nr:hypothetical protein [Oscillospiraceae bacterium]